MKILIAEDDSKIAKLLIDYFHKEGWNPQHAADGQLALDLFQTSQFDVIILDIMLPKIDGIELCKTIRKKSDIPILMITAKDKELDKIEGLTIGADDYITKPFSIHEVIARVKVQLRRIQRQDKKEQLLKHKGIEIDVINYTVKINLSVTHLTHTEFDMLCYFMTHIGQIVTKQQLLKDVWHQDIILDENTVMVHIRRLRKKIESDPDEPEFIKTVWGLGYRLE